MAMGLGLGIALSILGYKGIEELFEAFSSGPRGERIQGAQLKAQEKISSAEQEGKRRALSGSREATRKQMEMLLRLEREGNASRREEMGEARLMSSQDRQMALLMAALQTMGQRDLGSSPGSGMVAALRG